MIEERHGSKPKLERFAADQRRCDYSAGKRLVRCMHRQRAVSRKLSSKPSFELSALNSEVGGLRKDAPDSEEQQLTLSPIVLDCEWSSGADTVDTLTDDDERKELSSIQGLGPMLT